MIKILILISTILYPVKEEDLEKKQTSTVIPPHVTPKGQTVIINHEDRYPELSPSNLRPSFPQQEATTPPPNTMMEYQAPNRVWEPNRFGPPKENFKTDPFKYKPLPTTERRN